MDWMKRRASLPQFLLMNQGLQMLKEQREPVKRFKKSCPVVKVFSDCDINNNDKNNGQHNTVDQIDFTFYIL